MLFPEFTAGELLVRFCRSTWQARIAAESRSYSRKFCNDRVKSGIWRGIFFKPAGWECWRGKMPSSLPAVAFTSGSEAGVLQCRCLCNHPDYIPREALMCMGWKGVVPV